MLILNIFNLYILKYHSTHSEHKRSDKSSSGRLQEVKNNGKSINRKPQIVVAVAYRKWSPVYEGSNYYKASTGKVLVFWIGCRFWEVVANTRGGRKWRFDMYLGTCYTVFFARRNFYLQTPKYSQLSPCGHLAITDTPR